MESCRISTSGTITLVEEPDASFAWCTANPLSAL